MDDISRLDIERISDSIYSLAIDAEMVAQTADPDGLLFSSCKRTFVIEKMASEGDRLHQCILKIEKDARYKLVLAYVRVANHERDLPDWGFDAGIPDHDLAERRYPPVMSGHEAVIKYAKRALSYIRFYKDDIESLRGIMQCLPPMHPIKARLHAEKDRALAAIDRLFFGRNPTDGFVGPFTRKRWAALTGWSERKIQGMPKHGATTRGKIYLFRVDLPPDIDERIGLTHKWWAP